VITEVPKFKIIMIDYGFLVYVFYDLLFDISCNMFILINIAYVIAFDVRVGLVLLAAYDFCSILISKFASIVRSCGVILS
jgi:hypothetical protein